MAPDSERIGYVIGLLFGAAMLFAFLVFAIVAIVKAITRRTAGWIIAGIIGGLFLAAPALLIFSGAISGLLSTVRQQSDAASRAQSDGALIGEWQGTDNVQQTGYMILNRDRTARLIIANQVLDGSSLGGRFEWRVDSNHEPMWLDFVATRSDGTQGVLPMIVRFVGDRKIQVRWNADFTSRPAILLIRTLRHNWCFRNSDVPQARVHVVEVLVSSAHLLSATAARAPAFENKRRYNFVSVDLSC